MEENQAIIDGYQIRFVVSIGVVLAASILYIIISFDKMREKTMVKAKTDESAPNYELPQGPTENDELPSVKTIKKSISFNTVFNLEEFMVRLYKIGFLVRRMKAGGIEKERFLSIDRKGNLRFHKLSGSKNANGEPLRCTTPYFKFPIGQLKDCFACEESPPPSFIMDFKGKTLHLAVQSLIDRDYIVKGLKLIMQRAKNNNNFLLRNGTLLEQSPAPSEMAMRMEEEEEDEFDDMSQTTMNTSFRR